MVKQIPLSGKHGKGKFALVDDEDYGLLSKYSWYMTPFGYAASGDKALRELGHRFMHRVVNRTPDGLITDHINHDTIDNRRCNLRTVSDSQNLMNARKQTGKSSKYKGVFWNKLMNAWECQLSFGNERFHLGFHTTQREAALAYNQKAIECFGEFAHLNAIFKIDKGDIPVKRRYDRADGMSVYYGVSRSGSNYCAYVDDNGKLKHLGNFPDEKFAARVHDAGARQYIDTRHTSYINFPDLPLLDLGNRYVFRSQSSNNAVYLGVYAHKYGYMRIIYVDKKYRRKAFRCATEAADDYDKLTLIHRDSICCYLNFPERLADYLAEIGDQIISPKPIVVPDLD